MWEIGWLWSRLGIFAVTRYMIRKIYATVSRLQFIKHGSKRIPGSTNIFSRLPYTIQISGQTWSLSWIQTRAQREMPAWWATDLNIAGVAFDNDHFHQSNFHQSTCKSVIHQVPLRISTRLARPITAIRQHPLSISTRLTLLTTAIRQPPLHNTIDHAAGLAKESCDCLSKTNDRENAEVKHTLDWQACKWRDSTKVCEGGWRLDLEYDQNCPRFIPSLQVLIVNIVPYTIAISYNQWLLMPCWDMLLPGKIWTYRFPSRTTFIKPCWSINDWNRIIARLKQMRMLRESDLPCERRGSIGTRVSQWSIYLLFTIRKTGLVRSRKNVTPSNSPQNEAF